MKLIAGAKLDIGQRRSSNQDYLATWTNGTEGLFIVADGVGGSAAGDVASRLAVETIATTLRPKLEEIGGSTTLVVSPATAGDSQISEGGLTYERRLVRLVKQIATTLSQANRVIRRYGRSHPKSRGLSTTVALAVVVDQLALVGHAGDSRVYLIRGTEIQRLTQDHSLMALLRAQGKIADQALHDHPLRSGIYYSLGDSAEVYPTVMAHGVRPGDRLVICSDGLWGMLDDATIGKIVSAAAHDTPQATADALVSEANAHGGEDNISVIVVHCLQP